MNEGNQKKVIKVKTRLKDQNQLTEIQNKRKINFAEKTRTDRTKI